MKRKDKAGAHLLWICIGCAILAVAGCHSEPRTLFREVPPSRSGVTFTNSLTESPELNILTYLYYYNGAGLAVADFNNDGLADLYLGSNQGADALYLNLGNWHFKEVTAAAGLSGQDGWTTGITHADINGDGLEDIYICKPGGYRALDGRNLLYINQGVNSDGVPFFEEQAEAYGLDIQSLSTQAAFFDYDLDGDLDAFLLNHSVHPNRNYGRGRQREAYDALAGDMLLRNDDGQFVDVSVAAGIFQGKAGYGLGLGVSDLNLDGYPDLYVGNDFFENDYLYFNNGDGTFSEVISKTQSPVGHTSHFSMGNDIADVNNDGAFDIISLDMLPEDLVTYKTSGLEYAFPIYKQYLGHGFSPQYMQNTLQLNLGDGRFSEIAFLSGIASTEWSWGSLLADFDNDGWTDLFVSNGIKGATNDMDYMNFIANEDIQKRIDAGMNQTDMPLTREIPAKKVQNYAFRNTGDLRFENVSTAWLPAGVSYSQGCAYADLDGDGDLDMVVSHTDQPVSLLENTLDQDTGQPAEKPHTLQLTFKGGGANTRGIGTRAIAFSGDHTWARELFTSRGYLSSLPSTLHFGFGSLSKLDSMHIIWPGGAYQRLYDVSVDTTLRLSQSDASGNYYRLDTSDTLPIPADTHWETLESAAEMKHRENPTLDFDREPLIAYARSNEGPAVAVADFNRDGLEDFLLCGAKRQPSRLYLQTPDGRFESAFEDIFQPASLHEDTAVLFSDLNMDGWPDLILASGGNEFTSGAPLQPRLYMNERGRPIPVPQAFANIELNASQIGAKDWDGDGDPDLLLTADAVPGRFGSTPRHYLLENNGQGQFRDVTETLAPALLELGGIAEFTWVDLDGDRQDEWVVAGHWNPITVFRTKGPLWEPWAGNGLERSSGLWNTIKAYDVDGDGDMDLLGGNWGENTRLTASSEYPLKLLRNDFDGNGQAEPLVTYFHKGVETPFASRDELVKQMPFLQKKFRTYESFARASLEDLFGADALNQAGLKKVEELRSCLFLNDGTGQFKKVPLPAIAQASAIFDFGMDDFNGDGLVDVIPLGNQYEISTQLGRLDAFRGIVLCGDRADQFRWEPQWTAPVSGAVRDWDTLRIQGRKTYLIARNDDLPLFLVQSKQ